MSAEARVGFTGFLGLGFGRDLRDDILLLVSGGEGKGEERGMERERGEEREGGEERDKGEERERGEGEERERVENVERKGREREKEKERLQGKRYTLYLYVESAGYVTQLCLKYHKPCMINVLLSYIQVQQVSTTSRPVNFRFVLKFCLYVLKRKSSDTSRITRLLPSTCERRSP